MEAVEKVAEVFGDLEKEGFGANVDWDVEILYLIRQSDRLLEYLLKDETALGKGIRELLLSKDDYTPVERAAMCMFFSKPLYDILEG